jgi:hypothetical protein
MKDELDHIMQTLLYGQTASEARKWAVYSPSLRARAFLELLEHMERLDGLQPLDAEQTRLYTLAKAGDAEAAERLLLLHPKAYRFQVYGGDLETPLDKRKLC